MTSRSGAWRRPYAISIAFTQPIVVLPRQCGWHTRMIARSPQSATIGATSATRASGAIVGGDRRVGLGAAECIEDGRQHDGDEKIEDDSIERAVTWECIAADRQRKIRRQIRRDKHPDADRDAPRPTP